MLSATLTDLVEPHRIPSTAGRGRQREGFHAFPETRPRGRATVVTGHRPVPPPGRGRTRRRTAARMGVRGSGDHTNRLEPTRALRGVGRAARGEPASRRRGAGGSSHPTSHSTTSSRCSSTCPTLPSSAPIVRSSSCCSARRGRARRAAPWVLERNGAELVPRLYLAPPARTGSTERRPLCAPPEATRSADRARVR